MGGVFCYNNIMEKQHTAITEKEKKVLGVFEKYLSLWVFLCIVFGVLIGKFLPIIPEVLS